MAIKSKIQWTDATWNPAIGCSKISKGCLNCYMMRDMGGRFKRDVNGTVTRTTPPTFKRPLKWQKQGLKAPDGSPLKVFTSSLTDIFHPAIDPYRNEIWKIIEQCPNLIFQILTKRIERYKTVFPERYFENGLPKNVWLGVSAENQKAYDERVHLLQWVGFLHQL